MRSGRRRPDCGVVGGRDEVRSGQSGGGAGGRGKEVEQLGSSGDMLSNWSWGKGGGLGDGKGGWGQGGTLLIILWVVGNLWWC